MVVAMGLFEMRCIWYVGLLLAFRVFLICQRLSLVELCKYLEVSITTAYNEKRLALANRVILRAHPH